MARIRPGEDRCSSTNSGAEPSYTTPEQCRKRVYHVQLVLLATESLATTQPPGRPVCSHPWLVRTRRRERNTPLLFSLACFLASFLHRITQEDDWVAFCEYMQPYLQTLTASHVIKCITDLTKRHTVVLGIDESLMCKPARSESFFNNLSKLARCNSADATGQVTTVIVFASSLAIISLRDGWNNVEKMGSGRALLVLPLKPMCWESMRQVFDRFQSSDIDLAMALTGGHPRSVVALWQAANSSNKPTFAALVRINVSRPPSGCD